MKLKVEDYRDYYNQYFKEFNRLAVGEFADLSYGSDKPNDTSSSLESIIAYANYILEGQNKPLEFIEILNAGAGASSWMFRKLFKNVICTDPNKKYLKFIEHICEENKLQGGIFNHGMLIGQEIDLFDHVYFDYGNIERLPYLGSAIDLALKSIYVDDVDRRACCFQYREITIELCEALHLKWFDCEEALDEYGRSGIIIVK